MRLRIKNEIKRGGGTGARVGISAARSRRRSAVVNLAVAAKLRARNKISIISDYAQ